MRVAYNYYLGWQGRVARLCAINNFTERNFSVFLLRTLVVGRRQHSESIEVALEWSKEV